MKKLLLLVTITCFISNLNAQVNPDKQIQKSKTDKELGYYYQQKGKNQKKIAWWLLGGGAGLFTGGLMLASYGSWEYPGNFVVGSGAVLIGTVSMIASIPVFIGGAKNNGRADILLLQSNVPISMESKRNIPLNSVGIGIKIGR